MRKQLSLVHGMDRLFTLRFDNDSSLDNEVRTKSAIQLDPLINQRDSLLPLDPKSQLLKLVSQTSLISRFEEPRAKPSMNLISPPR
jgi:hypothetical protein